MIKFLLTGDNHFGLQFNRYPDVKDQLIAARLQSLQRAVRIAEDARCDLIVVAGDLFDSVTVQKKLVKQVVEVLAEFDGTVLVLPGNHDFLGEASSVWRYFRDAQAATGADIVLLDELRPYEFAFEGERLTVFPAFCQAKRSEKNNLAWIGEAVAHDGAAGAGAEDGWRIGIAHGAVQGRTPDLKQEYFLMTEAELSACKMDAWLIGHTHVPFPQLDEVERDASETGAVYNAGTHEQTDLANNTTGLCFVISLDASAGGKRVSAHAVQTGLLRFVDRAVSVRPESPDALRAAIAAATDGLLSRECVLRVTISGSCCQEEYEGRKRLYDELLGGFLNFEVDDGDLAEQVTMDKVRGEFAEMSVAYQLLEALTDDPKELQMAYELLLSVQNG